MKRLDALYTSYHLLLSIRSQLAALLHLSQYAPANVSLDKSLNLLDDALSLLGKELDHQLSDPTFLKQPRKEVDP